MFAQSSDAESRPLTMEEYEMTKDFEIADLDSDTYVKVDDNYVLDRYEMKKPYFITGDDGLKKRIDLYNLLERESMSILGMVIFYTNEKDEVFKALLPGFSTEGDIWERYFEDIHAIDKEEENFVLKLSYVLSKEVSFQHFKAQGDQLPIESATYGNDICFPGNQVVAMANGRSKFLRDVKAGDRVVTVDPDTKLEKIVAVKGLVSHEASNYAITQLNVVAAIETLEAEGMVVRLSNKLLEATPNHPMMTKNGRKAMSEIEAGEEILCLNNATNAYETFHVLSKKEYAAGTQKVYNMVADEGATFLMNGVMVLQK